MFFLMRLKNGNVIIIFVMYTHMVIKTIILYIITDLKAIRQYIYIIDNDGQTH